ncbi:MAG TPA: hypothetical protein VHI78_01995 [Bacteroidales bacterium]|jgi:hypothetical protein|nr:hypothetical protein [Bacteroidales bacterium]
MDSETRASKGAIIHEFKSNTNVIQRGGTFILSWNVEADQIDLFRNGTFFQTLGTSQQSLEKSEFYDSDKDVTFELVATKNGIQARSKPVVIRCTSLSSTQSSPDISKDLIEAVPWANFIGITGIVFASLVIISGLIGGNFSRVILLAIIPGLILIFPYIFLIRFSSRIKQAAANKDNARLIEAFKNLRLYFKSLGILIIIYLIILVIALIVVLINQ